MECFTWSFTATILNKCVQTFNYNGKTNLTTGFQNVDNSQHQSLIKFLEDVAVFPVVAEEFALQLKWLDIKEGNHVLDVGCGIVYIPGEIIDWIVLWILLFCLLLKS